MKNQPTLEIGKTYTLEDLHEMNRTLLSSLAHLFGLHWWLNDLPQKLRETMFSLPYFIKQYDNLTRDQQLVLDFLCDYPGQPVPVTQVYDQFKSKMNRSRFDKLLHGMQSVGWLIATPSPVALVLAVRDFSQILPAIPVFSKYIHAELPAEIPATNRGGQFLHDLIELSAFIFVEQPKITNRDVIAKQSLKKIMTRLSVVASKNWEEAHTNSGYPSMFSLLLTMLDHLKALRVTHDRHTNTRVYQLHRDTWAYILDLPLPHCLLRVFTIWLHEFEYNSQIDLLFLFQFFKAAVQNKDRWLTGNGLLAVTKSSLKNSSYDPLSNEILLSRKVLKPLLYFGLVEQTVVELPAPWTKTKTASRFLWRLSNSGLALATWLEQHPLMPTTKHWLLTTNIFDKNLSTKIEPLLIAWENIFPPEATKELIIQPDMSFLVPRTAPLELLWLLSVFGNTQVQDYVYQGSFTKESILQALKVNMPISELTEALEFYTKIPPSDIVWQTLKQWSAGYDRIILGEALILACDSPEMASEIAAQSKLANAIIGQIAPCILLITPTEEPIIRKWLEKKGWIPRPTIASSETLYHWIAKNKNSQPHEN